MDRSTNLPLGLFFLLVLLQALFVAFYVSQEKTVYFWDFAMYHDMAIAQFDAFSAGWKEGFRLLKDSFRQDYNHLFALPSVVSFYFFGKSRLVFILTYFLVFFIAYEFAVALVLQKVFSFSLQKALATSALLCVFVPPLWVPLLKGYPDIGAAACLVFALGLLIKGSFNLLAAIVTGFLLGLSIVLRRHFAYPVLALFLIIFFQEFFFLLKSFTSQQKMAGKLKRLLYVLVCAFIAVVFIYFIAPSFFARAVTISSQDLYSSYRRPFSFFLSFILSEFGLIIFSLFFTGFLLSFVKSRSARRSLFFILVFTLLWLLLWCLGPSQAGGHYLLHVLVLFAIIGLYGVFSVVLHSFSFPKNFVVAFFIALLLGTNSASSLWLQKEDLARTAHQPTLFSAPHAPEKRDDLEELKRLAFHIANTTSSEDKILAVGSSFVFNQDLLRVLYQKELNLPELWKRFVYAPEIDSNSPSPLNAFASANVYIIPKPPQYHLDPEKQKVITAIDKQFPPILPEEFFEKDAVEFFLSKNTKIEVWRRPVWKPGVLHKVMENIRKYSPPTKQKWIELSGFKQFVFSPPQDSFANIVALLDKNNQELVLFLNKSLMYGDYRFSAFISATPSCKRLSFEISILSEDGSFLTKETFPLLNNATYWIVSVPKPSRDVNSFAFLRIKTEDIMPCVLTLTDPSLEPI